MNLRFLLWRLRRLRRLWRKASSVWLIVTALLFVVPVILLCYQLNQIESEIADLKSTIKSNPPTPTGTEEIIKALQEGNFTKTPVEAQKSAENIFEKAKSLYHAGMSLAEFRRKFTPTLLSWLGKQVLDTASERILNAVWDAVSGKKELSAADIAEAIDKKIAPQISRIENGIPRDTVRLLDMRLAQIERKLDELGSSGAKSSGTRAKSLYFFRDSDHWVYAEGNPRQPRREIEREIESTASDWGKIARNRICTAFITGYTDTVGGDESNIKLSKQRAAAVASALRRTLRTVKVEVSGWGERRLQHLTGDAQDDYLNRRVDIVLECV